MFESNPPEKGPECTIYWPAKDLNDPRSVRGKRRLLDLTPDSSENSAPETVVANVLMAMPPPGAPPPMAAPMPMAMEGPDAGKIKTGLLIAGIGLIISAFIGFVGFGFVGTLIVLVGGIIMFTGTKSYPKARGMAMAGMGLVLVGMVLSIATYIILPSLFSIPTPTGTPTQAEMQALVNAVLTGLLLFFVAYLVTWIGVLLMPLRLVTGSSKGLVIAGSVLGILGPLIVLALVYPAFSTIANAVAGGTVDVNAFAAQIIAALIGLILGFLMILIGSILAGVGYIIGRGRLVPAGGAM